MSYTKLFSTIVTSTIWTEDDKTRICWITMLALANKNGEVLASIPGLARIAGISISDTESSLEKFLSPDTYSRTPDDEGRRIEKIEGGWLLLNHAKYRAMERDDDRRSKAAERKRRQRERDARNAAEKERVTPDVTHQSQNVTNENPDVTPESHQISQAEAEAEAEDVSPTSKHPPLPPKGGRERGKTKPSRLPTSPEAIRIAELFNRRLTTEWSEKEIKAFKSLLPIDQDELELVCAYTESERAKGSEGRQRRDLSTFLNNYRGEVDRAQAWRRSPSRSPSKPPKKFSGHHEDIDVPDLWVNPTPNNQTEDPP